MIVLGIETSCDETAAAVVAETGDPQRPWQVRSNVVASQVELHREWGGIVPELSARQHVRDICAVVEQALAGAGADAYDAIAVTQGPGLSGRSWSVCRSPSRWPGRAACRSSRCTTLPATSNRWCSRTARCRCRPWC